MDKIAFIDNGMFYYWSQIILTLAAVIAICLFLCFYLKKSGNGLAAALVIPLSIVASLVLARLTHWYCRADSYDSLSAAMSDFSTGGYTLMGVFGGCILAACLLRLLFVSRNLPEMLDCMSLAAAGGIAVGRLASLFNTSDRGVLIEGIKDLPIVYPVNNAVTGVVEYRLATFMLQSIVAAVIFLVLTVFWLLGTQKKNKRRLKDGDTCLLFLLCYGASQILLDSTRYDSLFMRSNGFVSIVQILGAVALVLAAVLFSIRAVRAKGWHYWFIILWVLLLAGVGLAGYMEYHVQRHGDQAVFAYSCMSAGLILYVTVTCVIRKIAVRVERRRVRR